MGRAGTRAALRGRAAASFFVRGGGVPKREPRRLQVLGQRSTVTPCSERLILGEKLNNVRVRLRDDDVRVFPVARANQTFGHAYGIQDCTVAGFRHRGWRWRLGPLPCLETAQNPAVAGTVESTSARESPGARGWIDEELAGGGFADRGCG